MDASANLIGAVLLQNEQPLAYATKTLNEAQRKYPQIEKEVYAIRYACTKFYEYISVQTSDYRNRSQITNRLKLSLQSQSKRFRQDCKELSSMSSNIRQL